MTQQDVAAAVVRIAEISGDRAAPGFNETGRLARINQIANELLSALQQRSGAVERERVARIVANAESELVACSEYLEPLIDADGDSEGFHPNREMALKGGVDRAIDELDALHRQLTKPTDAILGGQSCPPQPEGK